MNQNIIQTEKTKTKTAWWKRIVYIFLILASLIVGVNILDIHEWGVPLILTIPIFIASYGMVCFCWGKLWNEEKDGKIKQIILKNKKFIKWVVLSVIVVGVIYFLLPKYYFIKDGSSLVKCNKISGQCHRKSGGDWILLVK